MLNLETGYVQQLHNTVCILK